MDNVYGTIIFFVGPTGCGKTTFRRKGKYGKYPCISPDDLIVGRWSFNKAASAWAHARNMFVEMLRTREHDTLTVDAQFVDPVTRKEWIELAYAFGYVSVGAILNTSFRQILANHKKRGDRKGYGKIPYKAILSTYRLFRFQMKTGKIQQDFHRATVIPWACL